MTRPTVTEAIHRIREGALAGRDPVPVLKHGEIVERPTGARPGQVLKAKPVVPGLQLRYGLYRRQGKEGSIRLIRHARRPLIERRGGMKTKWCPLFSMLAILSLVLGGCIGAMQTTAKEPAGAGGLKPTQEDKDAGLVGIASGFSLKNYPVVVVRLFKVTEPEVKDDEDRQLAAEMPSFLQGELVRRLRESGLFTRVVNASETEFRPGAEKALVLEGEIARLARGSRALRYFVGFGAGRSKAQTEMRFVDAQSGQPLLVTADRRVAAYGVFGGDSREHLRESFDDMARDLGRFLVRLNKGEAPKKEEPPTR